MCGVYKGSSRHGKSFPFPDNTTTAHGDVSYNNIVNQLYHPDQLPIATMSSAGKPFVGLAPSSEKRPASKFFGPAGGINIVRDNFSLTTWLCIGAVAQGALFLAIGRTALLPAVGLLAYRTFIAYAMSLGFIHNTYMDGVMQRKYAAQFPDAEGNFSSKPADDEIVVLLIGTRCNHPLGLLAPEFNNIAGMFVQMAKDLDEHGEEFGFLGMTSWVNNSQRESKNELMMVGYFRTPDGLHSFAHSKYHTNA